MKRVGATVPVPFCDATSGMAMGIRAKIRALRTVKIPIDRLVYGPKPSNRGGRIPLMNARWMFVPAVLTTIALVAGAAEPVKDKGWTQKQFIITFWCPPPATDQTLAAVAAEHYNLTWVPVEGLDLAAKHKLRAMLTSDLLSPETLHDAAKRAELDALIAKVKRHPAMEAYFITDEPGAGAFPGLGELVAYLRQRDPTHLAYINLFPTYANEAQLGVTADAAQRAKVGYPQNFAGVGTNDKTVLAYREHLKKFVEIVKPDLISYDHYHFMKNGRRQAVFPEPGPDPRRGHRGRQALPEHHPSEPRGESVATT